MPKKARELSAYQVRRLSKRAGKHAVGGVAGLLLEVKPITGTASWTFRTVIGNRRPDIGLGGYPDVTLESARGQAREIREQVRQGVDPIEARRAARDALRAGQAKRITFDDAALQCWRAKSQEFRNPKHAKQWLDSLKTNASPVIGALPVDAVELPHVVRILQPIWATKTESASRLRGRVETVLEWARVAGYRNGQDNPAAWKTLKHVLPRPSRVRKKKHHASLPWSRVREFIADLRKREGVGSKALEFLILTAGRSGEIRLAQWPELDLTAKEWKVPAERMKASKPHRVPLPPGAVRLLNSLAREHGATLVFPAPRGGALSDMTLSAVIKRMHEESVAAGGEGYLDPKRGKVATPHGFRSSFKDWARSSTSYPDEVSELALAHVNSDETRAAYARDELMPQRAKLMAEWAKFCDSPRRKQRRGE